MYDFVGLGIFFRMLRQERHLSLETAAEMAKITPEVLDSIESATKIPDYETAARICFTYNLPETEIWNFYHRTRRY